MADKFNFLNAKTILITGGAGAIGSNLINFLSGYRCKLIVIDNLSSGFRENIPDKKNIIFYKDSILNDNILRIIFKEKISYVFHLAAQFANQNSIEHPRGDLLTNALGTLKLLEYSNKTKVKRFIFASSSCVYGSANGKMNEELVTKLETPYAISKLAAEEYVHFFHRYYGLRTTVVRYFNAYGPGDPPGKYRNVIPNFLLKAMRKESLTIMGTGQETRDFTYMDDIVRGTILILTSDMSIGQIYNIGTGRQTKIINLAKLINNITGNPSEIEFVPKREWDKIDRRVADISKSERDTGYKPTITLKDGLTMTWKWLKHKYGDKKWL